MKKTNTFSFYIVILCITTFIQGMEDLPPEYKKNIKAQTAKKLQNLKKRKMCQTHPTNTEIQASKKCRKMAFEALSNCGHPAPEVVMLTNDAHRKPACVGEKPYISINFDEARNSIGSYGKQRAILHHEAAHLMRQYYEVDNHSLHEERAADRMAIANIGCSICAREFAQDFLEDHYKQNHTHSLLKIFSTISLKKIDAMKKCEKQKLIKKTSKISKRLNGTHPIDLERVLRIVKASKVLGESRCTYHQNNP